MRKIIKGIFDFVSSIFCAFLVVVYAVSILAFILCSGILWINIFHLPVDNSAIVWDLTQIFVYNIVFAGAFARFMGMSILRSKFKRYSRFRKVSVLGFSIISVSGVIGLLINDLIGEAVTSFRNHGGKKVII